MTGAETIPFLERVFTRNIGKMAERSAHYGLLCSEGGTILDDEILFRLSDGPGGPRFLLTANAVNTEKVLAWLKKHSVAGVEITDKTQALAQLSIQGPQAPFIIERFLGGHYKKFKPRSLRELALPDMPIMIARTGYTGEHGYELFVPAEKALQLWDALITAGSESGLRPCGHASRDILRIEAGYLLYGNDIDESRTPLEAGLDCFVDFRKNFIGREQLLRVKETGIQQKLAGFLLIDKSVPRTGGSIFSENREIGAVTSGALSPSLRRGIGLGYVTERYAQAGQEIEIEVRDREIVANIVELPFPCKK